MPPFEICPFMPLATPVNKVLATPGITVSNMTFYATSNKKGQYC